MLAASPPTESVCPSIDNGFGAAFVAGLIARG
jgi:NCAIR mutase (PurE)-related protein